MREILIRGKRIDNGEWVEGNLFVPDEVAHRKAPTEILVGTNVVRISYEVDPATVGQYTGLTDKNGKRIFEGDVLKYHEPFVMKATGVVCFGENQWSGNSNVGFYMKWIIADLPDILRTDLGFWCNEREVEVIGNIHDTPELMKEEPK